MECLKLYDKAENGTMLLAELEHSLKALGKWQQVALIYNIVISPILFR
jgi:hypothetical protein